MEKLQADWRAAHRQLQDVYERSLVPAAYPAKRVQIPDRLPARQERRQARGPQQKP